MTTTVNRIATNVGGSYVPGFNAVVAGTVLEAGELGWDVVGGPFRGTDSRPGHAAAVVQAVEQAELGPVRLRALTAT